MSTRSKIGRDEIKWQELLLHFRSVQAKHEKARRQALGADTLPGFSEMEKSVESAGTGERTGRTSTVGRAPLRRRVTGELPPITGGPFPSAPRSGVLSPLNPKARVQNMTATLSNTALSTQGKQRRPTEAGRKV